MATDVPGHRFSKFKNTVECATRRFCQVVRGTRPRRRTGAGGAFHVAAFAVLGMKVKDYFIQGRRGWVRLHEKGGKGHEVPAHHRLEKLLDEYLAVAAIAAKVWLPPAAYRERMNNARSRWRSRHAPVSNREEGHAIDRMLDSR
ncbi:MAG TPA: hypothetical protein VGR45_11345 [Stellaceae bacterium]|nr:hypothetical protein [Stellaceae bacterium]